MVSRVSLLCCLYCYCLCVVSQPTMENCRRTEENCPGYSKTAEEVSQMKDLLSMVVQRVDVVVQRVDDASIQNTQMQENLTAKIQQLDEKLSKLAEASAACIPGGTGMTGYITCDNYLDVYIDGVKKIDRYVNYTTATRIAIPPGVYVLAVHCEDTNVEGGIIGSFSNGLVTDASWKCTNQLETGWNQPAYDDSNWENAYVIGLNGNSQRGFDRIIANVNRNASWIWTTRWQYQDKHVYCRYTF